MQKKKAMTLKKIRSDGLIFTRRHLIWDNLRWNNVIFTDETIIRTNPVSRKKVLCKKGERYLPHNTMVRKVAEGESVMFRGSIGGGKRLNLSRSPMGKPKNVPIHFGRKLLGKY